MVFLLNTFGKASVPIIDPTPFPSSAAVVASALRIGLAIFSLLVLLAFGGIDSRSNPCVLRSDATYLEACFQTFFSDSHRLFVLHGRCQGSNRFGSMSVIVARLLRGWKRSSAPYNPAHWCVALRDYCSLGL